MQKKLIKFYCQVGINGWYNIETIGVVLETYEEHPYKMYSVAYWDSLLGTVENVWVGSEDTYEIIHVEEDEYQVYLDNLGEEL